MLKSEFINHPSAWTSLSDSQWMYYLTKKDIKEIKQALFFVRKLNLADQSLDKDSFKLPTLMNRLCSIRKQLTFGVGVALIRGLPVDEFSVDEAKTIFWGLCQYLGDIVPQDSNQSLIYSVRDMKNKTAQRYSETNHKLSFHTDGCDIISLLAFSTPIQGGMSKVVSSTAVYNKMVAKYPELADILKNPLIKPTSGFDGVCHDFETYSKSQPLFQPIFHIINSYPAFRYASGYINSYIKSTKNKNITVRQLKAIETLNALANESNHQLQFYLKSGDMEFCNNNCIFHARESFSDGDSQNHQRHIIRLWVDVPEVETIPPLFGYREKNTPLKA